MIDWLFYTSYGLGAAATLLGMYSYSDNDLPAWEAGVVNWTTAAVWPMSALILVCIAAHQGLTRLGAWIRKHNL